MRIYLMVVVLVSLSGSACEERQAGLKETEQERIGMMERDSRWVVDEVLNNKSYFVYDTATQACWVYYHDSSGQSSTASLAHVPCIVARFRLSPSHVALLEKYGEVGVINDKVGNIERPRY